MKKNSAIADLLKVMAKLRSPTGCPWDREQSHMTLRRHAIEEVYELIDAIEARDDHEMAEELGDLLLQVVFHCQLARERGAFDFVAPPFERETLGFVTRSAALRTERRKDLAAPANLPIIYLGSVPRS